MPSTCNQDQILQAINSTALAIMADSNSDSDLEAELSFLGQLLNKRYLASRIPTHRHDPRFNLAALRRLPEDSFLQLFRTTFPSFLSLLDLIKENPIFHNQSQNFQRDPSVQLAVALCRLGSNGNGAASRRLQNLFSVGYGTISLYTQRVITAILSLGKDLLKWPTSAERLEHSQVMQEEGIPGCIGFVDGTTIPLSQKPTIDGNLYFDRKKRQDFHLVLFFIIKLGH